MRRSRTILATLALAVALGGCAGGPRGPKLPIVSPTGIVYELGTPPVRTRYSQTAVLYLVQGFLDRALEMAKEGLLADPTNPIHYYLAGLASSRLHAYDEADEMFTEAQRLYPAYQLEIEPERMAAWGDAYNQGVQAFDSGNVEGAIKSWTAAARMYDLRAEAHRNLGNLLTREGVYEDAIEVYRRALAGLEKRPATVVLTADDLKVREEDRISTEESLAQVLLFVKRYAEAEPLLRSQVERDTTDIQTRSDLASAIAGQSRTDEAATIYSALLSRPDLNSTQLFNLGVALFKTRDYQRSGEAFGRLTQMRPESRDAWFNYANALFAGNDWTPLLGAGDHLADLDPLGKDVLLLAARAHLENGDPDGARAGLKRHDDAPIFVKDLQMRPLGTATRIVGQLVGNAAEPGSPVRLRFWFYDEGDALGSETVDVVAPAKGESKQLEVLFQTGATAFRYELVP